ncbi:MAG TPA: 16S rRNA (cytidine(1402)-2'-O)-methyltransferase [Planctomycetota bacterium]|nr:16S rRNA (cytidine(1402)-2'-O)-methyltransferase [Planctomycetota bacterium]
MPLYVVATPLGNLSDMTARAQEILRACPIIAAEDTRSARRLLSAFQIPAEHKQLISYGEHNEASAAPRLAEALASGQDIAIVSEGGTPLVSDPGFRLVRAAIDAGVAVVPIPGPNAAIAALSASGLPVHGFIFRGFLPKKPGARRRILESLVDREETLIFYESPQRVLKIMPELVQLFGADRQACLAREITKLHETFLRMPLGELAAHVAAHPLKGECTLLIAGVTRKPADISDTDDGSDY